MSHLNYFNYLTLALINYVVLDSKFIWKYHNLSLFVDHD